MSDSGDGEGQPGHDERSPRREGFAANTGEWAAGAAQRPGKDSVVPAARAGDEIRRHLNAERPDEPVAQLPDEQDTKPAVNAPAPAGTTASTATASRATSVGSGSREELASRLDGTGPDRVAIAILGGIIVILAICVIVALAAR